MATTPEEPMLSLRVASAYSRKRQGISERLHTDHTISPSISFGQLVRKENESLAVEELVKRLQMDSNIFNQADYLNRIHDIW